MTENLNEMVAEVKNVEPSEIDQAEVERIATTANETVADSIQEEIIQFAQGLSSDVKIVTHANNTSIKFKNKNFVYLTKNKKKTPPLKIQVKQEKKWNVITVDPNTGFDALKQAIRSSFNALQ